MCFINNSALRHNGFYNRKVLELLNYLGLNAVKVREFLYLDPGFKELLANSWLLVPFVTTGM